MSLEEVDGDESGIVPGSKESCGVIELQVPSSLVGLCRGLEESGRGDCSSWSPSSSIHLELETPLHPAQQVEKRPC